MHIKIKILDQSVREYYMNHGYYNDGDAGLDLFVPQDTLVKSHSTAMIKLHIACEAHLPSRPTSFYMYPRSSISKTPLRLANSVGIIDAGYRGPLIVAVDNISDTEYIVRRGTRLVQICGPMLEPITYELKSELSTTSRGSGGYGSTGI
tara:strand:+ start:3438 stop:3884 length:447 start_codon:yes stop_codon:yes gene_type:complete